MGEVVSLYRNNDYFCGQVERVLPKGISYRYLLIEEQGENLLFLALSGNPYTINELSQKKQLTKVLRDYVKSNIQDVHGYVIGIDTYL